MLICTCLVRLSLIDMALFRESPVTRLYIKQILNVSPPSSLLYHSLSMTFLILANMSIIDLLPLPSSSHIIYLTLALPPYTTLVTTSSL